MERLTNRIGEHVYYTKLDYSKTIPSEYNPNDIGRILQALCAYEDTNHTPEECAAAFEERDNYKMLRADADRIREGMMQKELMLISEKMRLEKDLAAYRAAEQDGTLLRLPCKVGDMVFVDKRTLFERWRTKGVSEDIATGEVVSFRKNKTSTFVKIKFYFKEGSRTYFENYVLSAFGKTVFLTLEAAEATLKEQEANQ